MGLYAAVSLLTMDISFNSFKNFISNKESYLQQLK